MDILEHLSAATGLGVTVLDVSGGIRFESSLYTPVKPFLQMLQSMLDCAEVDRVALLYGCYQSRRFGGRYIFFTPSGMTYCASMLTEQSGVLAGPFLMTDPDEYIEVDILGRHSISADAAGAIRPELCDIPVKTPVQARAVSEMLYVCATSCSAQQAVQPSVLIQKDAVPTAYSIKKEDELIAAISIGDAQTAGAVLNDILGHILFDPGLNMETLRLRVVELMVLLSRAALKGGANIDAIFGLNYSYLREIDALASPEDAILWLHSVTRRFAQHVFDFAGSKHVDVLFKAVSFIKTHYAEKITLQDVADSVYLNVTYFSKVFKEETGQTPGSFITGVRIDASKRLLSDPSVNIVDIPELVGFESQSYFTQVFKKSEGCTPGQYRRKSHA
jgi:AraC-like DNA-binding protein